MTTIDCNKEMKGYHADEVEGRQGIITETAESALSL